jgi:hypothetical protein
VHDLAYVWEGSKAFAKRWRLAQLAQPGQYQLVEVPTKRGISKALLFPRATLRAEYEAERPFREALAIKRERLRGQESGQAAFNLSRRRE